MVLQRLHSLLRLAFTQSPEMREVVDDAVRYHSERYPVAHFRLHLHKTVHSIVESGVTAHNDYCLIAVVYHHPDKPFHTRHALALHVIEVNAVVPQTLLYLVPAFAFVSFIVVFGTVKNAPSLVIIHIDAMIV